MAGSYRGRRPFEFTPEKLQKIEDLAARGLNKMQVASMIGCHKDTFYGYLKEIPAIEEAYERGRARGVAFAAGHLIERIREGNVPATVFFLKSVGEWRDTPPVLPVPINPDQDSNAPQIESKYDVAKIEAHMGQRFAEILTKAKELPDDRNQPEQQ